MPSVASEVVYQPLHPGTGVPVHEERVEVTKYVTELEETVQATVGLGFHSSEMEDTNHALVSSDAACK